MTAAAGGAFARAAVRSDPLHANRRFATMKAKRHTLANALRIAGDRYAADAADVRRSDLPEIGRERIADTFDAQAKEALDLADKIEDGADSIVLED